jgi:uncharacterized protein YecT (DUF1311 family)
MRNCLRAALLVLVTTTAAADQQAWVSRRDADRAAALMQVGTSIRLFCAPCDDPAPTTVRIARVEVKSTGTGDLWEVEVNGQPVDLAYTYVERDGRWQDLALLLGLEAQDVPRFLLDGNTGRGVATPTPADELSGAEDELAGLLDGIVGSLPPASAKELLRAQDAWRRYRDLEAAFEGSLGANPAAATVARLRLTRARVAELERLEPGEE